MRTLQHSLTLHFGRVLTEAEWRVVIESVRAYVPFVDAMRADATFDTVPCETQRYVPGEPEYWH